MINNNNGIDNNIMINPMIFPSMVNMRVINNQIFVGLNMNQINNPIKNVNQNELIIIFRSSSGIEIKINANPNMSVHELLNIFCQKINLIEENKNKIFFLYQGDYLRYTDNNNILKVNLTNGSVVTVIDINNIIRPNN